MTDRLAGRVASTNSQIPLETLVRKHQTQTRAGEVWGVSQSAISRLLSGNRGGRGGEALKAIAAAEGIPAETILLAPARRLHLVEELQDASHCFEYDVEDPHGMLKQVQHWFCRLPTETRMKRQVVRAVMRALFDESFDAVHPPTREWRAVMQNAEGREELNTARETRRTGPR